jgi:hypothetical protein
MIVELLVRQHGAIEQRLHPAVPVIDQGERGDSAGRDAQDLLEQLRPSERQARAAEHLGQAIDVDPALVEADQQPQPASLVLEEQVLAVAARQVAGVPLGLLDGGHRRMLRGGVRDPELVEPTQQFRLTDRHGGPYSEAGRLLQRLRTARAPLSDPLRAAPKDAAPENVSARYLPSAADHVQASGCPCPAAECPRRKIAIMMSWYAWMLQDPSCAMAGSR